MVRLFSCLLFLFFQLTSGFAEQARPATDLQSVLQNHREAIERASRKTIDPVLAALVESKLESVPTFLEAWRDKNIWQRVQDGLFFLVRETEGGIYTLIDIESGAPAGTQDKNGLNQLKPNSGVRNAIASALVRFQLSYPDIAHRLDALISIERDPQADHLAALRVSIETEPDGALKARKQRLERLLTMQYDTNSDARLKAIAYFDGDVAVDVRAVLNRLLTSRFEVAKAPESVFNIARTYIPGRDIAYADAYGRLVEAGLAAPLADETARKAALVANIQEGRVAGTPVQELNTQKARDNAYRALAAAGTVPPLIGNEEQASRVDEYVFFDRYLEPDKRVTDAAKETLTALNTSVGFYNLIDLTLDGLSLASIYFLAAIGLAITFGVMGIINMAHGEFIMIGAYTGYVVQQFVPDYTLSIILALPLAFIIAGLVGVAMERLVIRHLIHRPLETLLATFGISIALQQIAKNIFGTQARPLTAPGWLDGSLIVNDVVAISYIRIAIFVLAALFLVLLLFILKRTRLGLEVRAVTQNPRMAASMGINTDRVNMLTFALGSGIAGIAGVAIGLFAQVTSELGSSYIVQSFMTVVVGGVGNIWGTLAGAGMIGSFQKAIEWFNPSNTLAAQTYMIVFIIIFIQFRPKGIIALKGRAAGD